MIQRLLSPGVAIALLLSSPVQAQKSLPEYQVMAALIYKLTKFVTWPDIQTDNRSGRFGVCVLGENLFGNMLDALEQRKVGDKLIRVYRFDQSSELDQRCQLVFIGESKQAFLDSIVNNLGDRPVLTISDFDGFAQNGGMIEFTKGQQRIGFRINLNQVDAKRLKIAAPLLQLATIVETEVR